jgi:hypothetical protein
MSQIVNLTEIINKNKVLSDLDLIQDASEIVLDSIEEHFDGGILIGTLNSKLQMSSTIEDEMEIIQLLEEALENLYKEINYD